MFTDPLVQIAVDNSRNILYVRSEKGSLQVYYLGQDGKSLSKVAAVPLQNTVHNASHIARYATFELQHDKTKNVCQAMTQISLGTCPVWSEALLCAVWVAKDSNFLQVDREDWSDWAETQTYLSLHLAHRSVCWFCRAAAQFIFSWTSAW